MAAELTDHETAGKTPEQKKAVKMFRDARDLAIEYCRPYFDQGVRYYNLFAGKLPPELEGTFSKVMLNVAFAMVEDELPRSGRTFLSTPEWFNVNAADPMLEPVAETIKKWLVYQTETVQKLPYTVLPTLQAGHIFGNGYRIYTHRFKKSNPKPRQVAERGPMGMPGEFSEQEQEPEYRSVIMGQPADYFHVLPLPGGGMVNSFDDTSEQCVDGVIWNEYMKDTAIKTEVEKGAFDKGEAGRLFKALGSEGDDPAEEWKGQLTGEANNWASYGMPGWMKQIRDQKMDLSKRYLTSWFFQREKWTVIAENSFVLYDGPPIVDCIPISNHKATMNLGDWFARSLIGLSEDVILSILYNFAARSDYLMQTMNPATYIPSALLDHHGGDTSRFTGEPYDVIDYPARIIDINKAIFHDRYPDIPQQAFMDAGDLNNWLQKVSGQPDFRQGMQGAGNAGDIGATGVVSLIGEGTARSMFRAMNVEMSGLSDDLYLTLKFGDKYKQQDEFVPIRGESGFPWEMIPHRLITDGYGIEVTGTRNLNLADQTFRKMLSVAQHLIGNPAVPNQPELVKQLMDKSGGFENIPLLMSPPQDMAGGPAGAPAGGQGPEQNATRSMENRNTVEPGTGAPVAAGNLMV